MSVVLLQTWERGREFLHKAGTIILLGAVAVWAMSNLPLNRSRKSYSSPASVASSPLCSNQRIWYLASCHSFGIVAKER